MTFTDQLQSALSLLGTTEITINREGASPAILHPDRTLSIDGQRIPVTDYLSPATPAPPAVPGPVDHDPGPTHTRADQSRLKEDLDSARATILAHEERIEALQGQLASERGEHEHALRLQADLLASTRREADQAQAQADQLRGDLDKAGQVASEAGSKLAQTLTERDNATRRATDLASDLAKVQSLADEQHARIQELENQLADRDTRLAQKNAELANVLDQLNQAHAELEHERDQARQAHSQLSVARQAIEDGATRQTELEGRLHELTDTLDTATSTHRDSLAERDQRIEDLQAQLVAERAEHERELSVQVDLVASTRREVEQAQATTSELQATISELRHAASDADGGLAQAHAELDQATSRADQLATDLEQVTALADERLTRIHDLETHLATEQADRHNVAEQVSDLTARLERAQSTIRSLKADIPTLAAPAQSDPGAGRAARAREADDKEGDRRRTGLILVITALLVATVALFAIRALFATDEPAPQPSSVTSVPDPAPPRPTPTTTPSPTPSPSEDEEEESPTEEPSGEPTPEPTGPPQPQVVPEPDPAPAPTPSPAAPTPTPTQVPEPAPVPGHVTNLSASVSSSGSSVTISATVTTSGPMSVTVTATVGGVSIPMGTRQVNGSATFTGTATVPAGTHTWVVNADGLVNSGTITTF